jgi:DNA-binding transcriptional MerR regulator
VALEGERAAPMDAEQAAATVRAAEAKAEADTKASVGGGKALTIGAVCKALGQEFPDISISKIRYLEDQKLLTPRRTPGGYRLYSTEDVARLRTILRLQRDEFLPLRVIRQELARGRSEDDGPPPAPGNARPASGSRRAGVSVRDPGTWATLDELLETTGATRQLVAELEDFGLVKGQVRLGGAGKVYDDTDREIVRACTELSRYGVAGRNLRVFKTSADRESSLLQQLLAPSLRSRNPERRRDALDTLENLATIASHLEHLLLVADLRRLVRSGS